MDPIEQKLRRLKAVGPSPELRERIFGPSKFSASRLRLLRRPVPLGWSIAAACVMALAGYGLAQLPDRGASDSIVQTAETRIQLIYKSPSERNLFDFTRSSQDFLPGKLKTVDRREKEV